MREFSAVIFDMDGIIFDSERGVIECWKEIAEKYDIKDIEASCIKCTGTNSQRTKEIMHEIYGEYFPYDEYAAEASRMFHEKYDGGKLPVKKGAENILRYLKERNVKTALASSTRKEVVVNELRDAGLLEYFDEIVTGDMVKRSKPAPDIFLLACEKVGAEPSNAYAIEDSYNGIRSASAGGLRPIMVPDILGPDEEMESLSEVVLNDLDEVILYLDNA